MRDLAKRIEVLEGRHMPGRCLECEMAALNGSAKACRHQATSLVQELQRLNDDLGDECHAHSGTTR